MQQNSSSIWTDIVAGFAVFFSMSYVAFANPILLAKVGMPSGAVFYATCLVAALATFASGYFARSPTALAPGLALSAAISQYLSFDQTTITWESALVVCMFAGIALFALSASRSRYRRQIIDSIPPTIKLAVIGGIGSVLADNAIQLVRDQPGEKNLNVLFFAGGIAILVMGYIILRSLSLRLLDPLAKGVVDLLGRSSFFLSVIVVALLVHTYGTAGKEVIQGSGTFLWFQTDRSFGEIVAGALKWESIPLLFFVLYILIADIVGSPYHMALDDADYDHKNRFSDFEEMRIQRSLYVDSAANIVAPILGTSPVVYYAENFAGKVVGGTGPWVAYTTSIWFLLSIAFGLYLTQSGQHIFILVPGLAVAPVLFFVGVIIISKALWPNEGDRSSTPTRQDGAVGKLASDFIALRDRLPAAIAIVVTPVNGAGFEMGVAAGILSYYLIYSLVDDPEVDAKDNSKGALNFLALMAVISLFIKAKLYFGF